MEIDIVNVIYCADGNKRFAKIAIDHGFNYGAQLPGTTHFPLYFADQNWKKPNRTQYMAALKKHKPYMGTVLDLENETQLNEVLDWAAEAAEYVNVVLIIPKIFNIIDSLPREINGTKIRLAYSVPTKYGGTSVPIWEFYGWPIHLLGGSPHAQMEISHYLDVKSVDGNIMNLMATRWLQFWTPGDARYAKNRWWPTLRESNNNQPMTGDDLIYEAFARSCKNIMTAWRQLEPVASEALI